MDDNTIMGRLGFHRTAPLLLGVVLGCVALTAAPGMPGTFHTASAAQVSVLQIQKLQLAGYINNSTAVVSWLPPAGKNLTYRVRVSGPNVSTFGPWASTAATTSHIVNTPVGTTRTVQVRAVSAGVVGPVAQVTFKTPNTAALLPPATPSAAPMVLPLTVTKVSDFGARGDGVTDDSAALQKAFDATKPGSTVVLPAGKTFAHSKILTLRTPNMRLTGGGVLLATEEQTSEVYLHADGVKVDHIILKMGPTSKRWGEFEKMKIRLGHHSNLSLSDVTVDGAAAAGVYVGGAKNFTLTRVNVYNTRADAIHITEGSSFGKITDVVVRNAGDDAVAVVSYSDGPGSLVNNVTVLRPVLVGQHWGRAFSVVGGDNIVYQNVYSSGSAAAGVYVACEGNWNSQAATNVTFDGGTLVGSNSSPNVDHGAVVVFNGCATANRNITVKNFLVANTYPSSRNLSVLNYNSSVNSRVWFDNIRVNAGPSTVFFSNGPASAYRTTNIFDDGVRLPNKVGW